MLIWLSNQVTFFLLTTKSPTTIIDQIIVAGIVASIVKLRHNWPYTFEPIQENDLTVVPTVTIEPHRSIMSKAIYKGGTKNTFKIKYRIQHRDIILKPAYSSFLS